MNPRLGRRLGMLPLGACWSHPALAANVGVEGGLSLPITAKTAAYTATATILTDATSASFTVNLPASSGIAGRI